MVAARPPSASSRAVSIPAADLGAAPRCAGLDHDPVEPHVGEVQGGVEGRRAGRHHVGGGHHEHAGSVVGGGHERQLVGTVTVQHVADDAVEAPPVPVTAGAEVVGVEGRGAGRAGADRAEQCLPLRGLTAVPHQRDVVAGGHEERGRIGDATQLLEGDGQLDRGRPHATVLGGHREAGPVELHVDLPETVDVDAVAVVDDGPDERRRALRLGDLADDALQLDLVVGELEVHDRPISPRCRAAGRGWPAARAVGTSDPRR